MDPPAEVEPMKIIIKPGAVPVKAKPRRYSTDQRNYMEIFMDRAEKFGFLKKNPNAKWISPALMVPKPGTKNFRLTFDLRCINAATEPMSWPMPHIESELSDLSGSEAFAVIDFVSGYWQLPLSKESQDYHGVMTPSGIYSPTRTLQGGSTGVANFQAKVVPCFQSIMRNIKAWLDDFLIHASDEEALLTVLEKFLYICKEGRLKVSARKSQLFNTSVRWCGRIIDGEGVTFDPSRISGVTDIHKPLTAGELCEFVYCLQWMSQSIPNFSERVASLRDVLEEAFKKTGKRTQRSIRNISLPSLSWSRVQDDAFDDLKESIVSAIKLAHYIENEELCVYTDASDRYWSSVISQCSVKELEKNTEHQMHRPLAFFSAEFTGHQKNWSTFEKEAYAIYMSFKKLDYILGASSKTHVYTDHRNLLFVFNPLAVEPTLARHVVSKVQRLALFLSQFSYTIEHVPGHLNKFADIMTRWLRGYRRGTARSTVKNVREMLNSRQILPSTDSDEFDWPDIE